MIIEFTGFAGVGKSYLKNLLYDELKKENIEVLKDKSFSKANYLSFFNLFLLFYSFYYSYCLKPKNFKKWIKSSIVWYKIQVKYKYYKNFEGIILIDEGYVHKFRFLRRNSKLKNLSLQTVYNDKFYLPDTIILVETDIETLKSQVKNRDNKDLDLTWEQYVKSINRTKKDIDKLMSENANIKYTIIHSNDFNDIKKIIKELDV